MDASAGMELGDGQGNESSNTPSRSINNWSTLQSHCRRGPLESWLLVYFWFTYHTLMSPFYIQVNSQGNYELKGSRYQKVISILITSLLLAGLLYCFAGQSVWGYITLGPFVVFEFCFHIIHFILFLNSELVFPD